MEENMTPDQLYQSYDGIIPDEWRKTLLHGSEENYQRAFLWTAERNFSRRVREIVQSLCIWRITAHYPLEIQFKMLDLLSRSLFQAREAASLSWTIFSNEETPA
jgi:hypothetical protein